MNISYHVRRSKILAAALALALPVVVSAEVSNEELRRQVDALQRQVTAMSTEVQQAAEWKNPNTLIHMAGYADVGYTKQESQDGNFVVGSFSPIFHFQYRDIVMLESELEFEIGDDGETEVGMEYLTLDWLINDYATLIAGRFLSPIGQFRQNLHPSWVNKLPSAPPGFGHDGAAPLADSGLQVRGGFPMNGVRANYAVYISNGPELNSVTEDEIEFELEGIRAEGFGADRDGEKTIGGRFALLPVSSLEVGLSFVTGKATVTELENEAAAPMLGLEPGPIAGETARDYDVSGADFVWFTGNLSLRGEYVKTEIGKATAGATRGEGATWKTWYTQLAYRIPGTNVEGVVRYTDFDSPHASEDQKQTAVGVNYLITNNFVAKLAYEANDGLAGESSDADRTLVQLAYGF